MSQLLGGLLEVKPSYVQNVEAMGLASQFFEFLSLEHSNNNVHNIRLCRQIIAAGSMPITHLVQMQVAEKVSYFWFLFDSAAMQRGLVLLLSKPASPRHHHKAGGFCGYHSVSARCFFCAAPHLRWQLCWSMLLPTM